jgi:hypothetical protein
MPASGGRPTRGTNAASPFWYQAKYPGEGSVVVDYRGRGESGEKLVGSSAQYTADVHATLACRGSRSRRGSCRGLVELGEGRGVRLVVEGSLDAAKSASRPRFSGGEARSK